MLDAFRKVISPDVVFGAHATAAKARVVWDERKFIRYAGERKLPLKFISVSFYDDCPGRFTRNWDFPGRIKHVRDAAVAAGYTNLWYGVDEGRIMYGTSRGHGGNRELPHRVVGDTWQAAYDARMVKQMFDHDVDYFASWGYFSGPYGFFEGLPTVSFHVAREAAKFRGMRRLSVSATKRDVPSTVALLTNLTLADGAALAFNYTEKTPPVLNVTGRTVTFGGASNVVVKVSTDGKRAKGGANVLTSGGKFANANVTLAEGYPDWVKGVSVVDGEIVLDVKPTGMVVIVK